MARVTALHIPHPTWADPLRRNYFNYKVNLFAIARWATMVTCSSGHLFSSTAGPKFHFPYPDAVTTDFDGQYLESNYLYLERWASNTCRSLRIPYKQWLRVDPLDPQGREWELANLRAIERWASSLGACCSAQPNPAGFEVHTNNYDSDPPLGEFDPAWGTSDPYTLPRDVDFTSTTPPQFNRGFRLNTRGSGGGLITTWQVLLDGLVVSEGDTNPVGELFTFYPISVDGHAGQVIQIRALDNGLGGAGYYPAIQAVVFGVVTAPPLSASLPLNFGT